MLCFDESGRLDLQRLSVPPPPPHLPPPTQRREAPDGTVLVIRACPAAGTDRSSMEAPPGRADHPAPGTRVEEKTGFHSPAGSVSSQHSSAPSPPISAAEPRPVRGRLHLLTDPAAPKSTSFPFFSPSHLWLCLSQRFAICSWSKTDISPLEVQTLESPARTQSVPA